MEGVKILSEEMIRNFGGETLFPFLIFLGAVILVFGICLISYYGFVEVGSIIEILIGVIIYVGLSYIFKITLPTKASQTMTSA